MSAGQMCGYLADGWDNFGVKFEGQGKRGERKKNAHAHGEGVRVRGVRMWV